MANFIQKFQNQSAYDADNTKQYPNTSLVGTDIVFAMAAPVDDSNVRIEVTVNQSQQAKIYSGSVVLDCDWIKVDGTEISLSTLATNDNYYTFTTGQHTILYKAKNPSATNLGGFEIVPDDLDTMTVDSFVASEGFVRLQTYNEQFIVTNVDLPSTIISIIPSVEEGAASIAPFECENLTIRNNSSIPTLLEQCQDCESMGGYVVGGVCKECNEFDEETGDCIDFGEEISLECEVMFPNYINLYVPASMVSSYRASGWHNVNAIQ